MGAIGLLWNINNQPTCCKISKFVFLFVYYSSDGNLVIYQLVWSIVGTHCRKGPTILLQTMIMMIAQCPWRSGKMLLSFTEYQFQTYLEGFIAKSLVDVSCTAKEPTGSVAVYGQGNTSLQLQFSSGRTSWSLRVWLLKFNIPCFF